MSEVCRLVDRAVVADFPHASIIQEFAIVDPCREGRGEFKRAGVGQGIYMVEGLGVEGGAVLGKRKKHKHQHTKQIIQAHKNVLLQEEETGNDK